MYYDFRIANAGKYYTDSFDPKNMTITKSINDEDGIHLTEVEFKVKYQLCPVCEGKGTHVNPDIDCNGITQEDIANDPGFFEDYKSGIYDVIAYSF